MNTLKTEDNFSVEYRTIQQAKLANKTTNIKNPKDWTIIKFGATPLITYKGHIYLPPSLATTVVDWYQVNLAQPDATRTYKTIAQIFFVFHLHTTDTTIIH
eukprot:645210-Ditylum_brightwellii.AAC.1